MKLYTPNDYKALAVLEERATPGEWFEYSNSALAKKLGLQIGAAAARIYRLEEMGLIQVHYQFDERTGRLIKRSLRVIKVPPAPWEPPE